MIRTRLIGLFVTTKCTLNCKHCCNSIPYLKAEHTDTDTIIQEIREIFKIYDYIDHLDFYGGEAMLHPDLPLMLKEAEKYQSQFGFIRILTNGTLVPGKPLLDAIDQLTCPFDFLIDNYEGLSGNIDKLRRILEEHNVKYRVNDYTGSTPYCDGWIDLGDYSDKHYSPEKLCEVYEKCYQAHHICLSAYEGKLFHCAFAAGAYSKQIAQLRDGDYIDLLDQSIAIEDKKNVARSFGTRAVEACKYCNGFDAENAPRFPAAEQLPRTRG